MTVSAEMRSGATVPRARMPDFFIVGQAKSGTTALYEMLRRHPQIFMPENKEPWFFASELHVRTPPRPQGTPKTLEEYASLFTPAGLEQRAGEASALYLWSRTAAGAIADVQPAARIIAILREPASLLRSLHLQLLSSYVETETDLRTALELEPERQAGRRVPKHTYWPLVLHYSEHVRYVEQLRRYHEHFPPEQVLILVYDDFRADNEATVRAVLRFLEVDQEHPLEPIEANPTLQVRSRRLHGLLRTISTGRGAASLAVKHAVKAVTPPAVRQGLMSATRRRALSAEVAPPDEQLMRELRERYRGEVEALSEYIGRDLVTLWGYERVT